MLATFRASELGASSSPPASIVSNVEQPPPKNKSPFSESSCRLSDVWARWAQIDDPKTVYFLRTDVDRLTKISWIWETDQYQTPYTEATFKDVLLPYDAEDDGSRFGCVARL